MVHPLISFLQGTYIRNMGDTFSFTEMNSGFLTVLNKGYEDYHNNKVKIDTVLKRIYEQHDGTLNISVSEQNRNKLVIPFDIEYVMKGNSFSDEVLGSLSESFNKWTDPNLHLSEGRWYSMQDTDF